MKTKISKRTPKPMRCRFRHRAMGPNRKIVIQGFGK